jgi:hypothetical protein
MDENPGKWMRWAEGLRSGPSTATNLRGKGYEARYRRMSDGKYTVWSRRPPERPDRTGPSD